jgi:hypothetical protein
MTFRLTRTIAVSAAIALAGCSAGHTEHAHALATSFLARANAICATAVRVQATHPFPIEHFDPTNPSPAQLPIVAAYFSRYGRSHQLAHDLDDLGEPSSGVDDWQHLRTLIHQVSANADAQIAAGRRHDVAAFESAVAAAAILQRRIAALGQELGFAAGDACAHEFG